MIPRHELGGGSQTELQALQLQLQAMQKQLDAIQKQTEAKMQPKEKVRKEKDAATENTPGDTKALKESNDE
ncbi:MAG: hypothetical protein QM811_25050 [Pirellulales bacterium]